jgi:hypothetical protein
MFPVNSIWNTPVDHLPVHARSADWINRISASTGFHMDFGSGTWGGGSIGIPYNVVAGTQAKVGVTFDYAGESDKGPYPIPAAPKIEYGSDHHILIVDMFDTSADQVASLHRQGKKAFCYISVGSWENWRPDKDKFPAIVLGNNYAGWPGEKWLDIRRIDLLAPILRARLDRCAGKGFDGVE